MDAKFPILAGTRFGTMKSHFSRRGRFHPRKNGVGVFDFILNRFGPIFPNLAAKKESFIPWLMPRNLRRGSVFSNRLSIARGEGCGDDGTIGGAI